MDGTRRKLARSVSRPTNNVHHWGTRRWPVGISLLPRIEFAHDAVVRRRDDGVLDIMMVRMQARKWWWTVQGVFTA